MTEHQQEVFYEIYRGHQREGPGSLQSTTKAYSLIPDLPSVPRILDIGCGSGAQTLHLAEIGSGQITAIDNYGPFIELLTARVVRKGLNKRIFPIVADMNQLPFKANSFDLIWAEGSIYQTGVPNGLKEWYSLIVENGSIAYTEICWLRDDIPAEPEKFWKEAYPSMTNVRNNLDILDHAGFRPVNHFVLPDNDWWDHYYNCTVAKLPSLRKKYMNDTEAISVIDTEEEEVDLFRRYSSHYGYVFYIGQKG